ncbi:MAG: replication-associated recombination protein A [Betaproteobacteria bacterium]|nr:replication-associated recombination protein A [Betaproteobacteria bacterium]
MTDLFTTTLPAHAGVPLAERLRPRAIAEVVGQHQLLAPGKPLAVAFASGKLHSMILWGPPGVGKTTLARLMADAFNADFIALSAVLSGVKDIRDAVARAEATLAQSGRQTILFVDEVHRFNKAQQDAFLPYVERGTVTFIGATTENPSFEVIGALLSRAAVYVLEPLSAADLGTLLDRALAASGTGIALDAPARDALVAYADGDGRRLVNLVEQLAVAAATARRDDVDLAFVEATIARSLRRFDKGGEAFYDQISALHKAVRGSDPDASLYWMCRMLDGGADPPYVARRMIRMATEDIGLADPRALRLALDAAETYERLGSPEGELALAECVLYLAVAPKSNAAYVAYGAAKAFIADDGSRPVPMRLRNAPTKLMKNLGYGAGYRYAHDEEGAYAAGETYLPDDMMPQRFYAPTDRGLEAKIRAKLEYLRNRDRAADDTPG